MALSIYDDPNQNMPIPPGVAPSAPTGITALLQDRNFLNLMAGIGAGIGGKGSVAEALAVPTIAYNQATASQAAGAKVAAQPKSAIRRYQDLMDRLGPITPRGTAGPTRLEAKRDGGYLLEGDLDLTPSSDPTDIIQEQTYPSQMYRPSLGQAPTPEEIEGTINYPFPTAPVASSAEGGAIPGSATPMDAPGSVAYMAAVPQQYTPSTPREIAGVSERLVQNTLTAEDLKGLNPQQVDQVIGNALNASQLEVQVMGLAGRDIAANRQDRRLMNEAERRARDTAATALSAAKTKAAETIAQSNLTPEAQERLFQRLDAATTLDQARNELVEASKLPKMVTSGEERDAFSRQQFGRTYSQLDQQSQGIINARILREKATYDIHATETGLYRIDRKTGAVTQVHGPTAAGTPAAPVAPRGGAISLEMGRKYLPGTENLSDEQIATELEKPENYNAVRSKMTPAERQAVDATRQGATPIAPETGGTAPKAPVTLVPYENLSPFAKSVSEPAKAPAFGAKPPTEGQAKALSFGSQALQAQEVVRDLEENQKEFGNTYGLKARNIMRNLSVAEAAGLGGAIGLVGGLPGAAVGGAVGVAVKIATPLLNAFDSDSQRAYLQAKLNWMSAILRKESGASISVGEFLSTDERYFPSPGESPEVIANKTRAREQAIRGLQTEAGRKLLPPQVVPFQGTPSAPQSTVPPNPTSGMVNLMGDALKKGLAPPQPVPGGELLQAPNVPKQVLPVAPSAQQQNIPGTQPKATEQVDRLARMELIGKMKSSDIMAKQADEHLKEVGYDALMRNMSYFKSPAMKAAIRSRMNKLGIKPQ